MGFNSAFKGLSGDRPFFQNGGNHLPVDTALDPRKLESSSTMQ